MEKWAVIKDGEVKCHGDTMRGFYAEEQLAELRRSGYKITVDGKPYKPQGGGKKRSN